MVSLYHQLPWNSHHGNRSLGVSMMSMKEFQERFVGKECSFWIWQAHLHGLWSCSECVWGAKHQYSSLLLPFLVFKNCYYVCVSVGTCILQQTCEHQRAMWGSQFSPLLWVPMNEARPWKTGSLLAEPPQWPLYSFQPRIQCEQLSPTCVVMASLSWYSVLSQNELK